MWVGDCVHTTLLSYKSMCFWYVFVVSSVPTSCPTCFHMKTFILADIGVTIIYKAFVTVWYTAGYTQVTREWILVAQGNFILSILPAPVDKSSMNPAAFEGQVKAPELRFFLISKLSYSNGNIHVTTFISQKRYHHFYHGKKLNTVSTFILRRKQTNSRISSIIPVSWVMITSF